VNRVKMANANIKSSEWQLKISQLDAATSVKQIYWQYVFLTAKQKLLIYQDSLYSGFLRAAELRAGSGETNKLEMITARSQSLEIKNQLFQVTSDIGVYSRRMMILLNTDWLPVPADKDLHRLDYSFLSDSVSIDLNPALGYVHQQVKVSQIAKKLERNQMLPDLNVGYFTQTIIGTQEVNGIPQNFGKDFRFTGIQAGISIPIWITPFASRAKAAKIGESIAQTDAESFHRSLSGNFRSLTDELRKYSLNVDYYENQAVPEANIIIEQATLSYKAGAMDYLDFVQTLNRALQIRQNYLESLNNCNQTIISLEYITGKIF
jgi:cobalt-zinc-cadmium resistance protein CzcA